MSDIRKVIGKNLKLLRKQDGIRQIDVAINSGVAYRHYQDIEGGKVDFKISTLNRLAIVLKVSPKFLLSEDL